MISFEQTKRYWHMKLRNLFLFSLLACLLSAGTAAAQDFKIIPEGYFRNKGVDVMAFYDFYPEGHQGGVCVIMNGHRVRSAGKSATASSPPTSPIRIPPGT